MSRRNDIRCPPYVPEKMPANASILDLAAVAREASNRYRSVIDERGDFDATIRAGRALAIATETLTSTIADAVACGDGQLT